MANPLRSTSPSLFRRVARSLRDRARRAKNDLAWQFRKRQVAQAVQTVTDVATAERLRGASLFFVPYAGVTPMFSQACVVAQTLKERGHSVVFARCFRLFERCPVMDMQRVPYEAADDEKLESCLHCGDNSLSMLAEYGLDAVD